MRFQLRRSFIVLRTSGIALRRGCVALALAVPLMLAACAPEVGSEAWCKRIEEKGVANVTPNEAADYARHCILR